MKGNLIAIAVALQVALMVTGGAAMDGLQLVPMPREVTLTSGTTRLSGEWVICVPGMNEEDGYAAELVASEAAQCFGWQWKIADVALQQNYVLIKSAAVKGDEPELFKEQGYILSIMAEGIVIEAPSAVGRYYGVQTLRQILRTAKGGEVAQVKIMDYPALRWRGISDDISRGQVSTVEDFKEIIRDLAFYKKNLYQPYMEDMFAFDTDPNIGRDRGAVTKAEMEQMVAEAKRNHVVLTPVFECLGHQDRLLSLPENRKYAEVQDPARRPWSFSPVLPEALEFLKKLIGELAESTPSGFFHIGGDESWDVGEGTSKKRVKQVGAGRVHAEFFARLDAFIKEQFNRQTMLYSDMLLRHPSALEHLPKDVILVDWHYSPESDYPSVKKLKDAGFKYIMVSPGLWSWATFYPNYSIAFRNVGVFADVAKREEALGSITSSWGDDGAENLRENNWLGYAFSGAAEWERVAPERDELIGRFVAVHYGAASAELAEAEKTLGWVDDLGSSYTGRVFHRTPRITASGAALMEKMASLGERMTRVRESVAKNRDAVKFHKAHLDSIDHVARRYLYMVHRNEALDAVARMLDRKRSGDLAQEQQDEIIARLRALSEELLEIATDFERLWLRRNKYPRLDYNLERLQGQIRELHSYIALAEAGELRAGGATEGVWFWYPDADPRQETAEGRRYFVRRFTLTEEPIAATVKCWADDKATLFVNGKMVIQAEYGNPPAMRNVRNLKKGENYLAVEGYNAVGAAGILIELSMSFADKSKIIITGDEQWRVAERVKSGWSTKEPKGKGWKAVKLLGKGLVKPWDFIDW